MQLLFLGTGPSKRVTKNGRTRSSLGVNSKGYSFVIDACIDFLEQTKREKIDKIDFIIQTHGHNDCTMGLSKDQLGKWLKEHNTDKMPVWMEPETWKRVKEDYKDVGHIEPHFFKAGEVFSPTPGLKIKPFRVIHSIQPGYPAVGFRFDGVVYSEDVGKIPEDSEPAYRNAHTIIFDAAMWFGKFIKGHHNVEMALEVAKKYCPDRFVLTQAGHTYPGQDEAEKKIKEYWSKNKGDCDSEITLAKDGMKITTKSLVSQYLVETKEGIYFVAPHGKKIWENKKSLIVKSKLYRGETDKLLYLLEDDVCYGIIKLDYPFKIDLKKFKDLEKEHTITEQERKKWWPYKEVLFAYKFDRVNMFDKPKKVKIPTGVQTFVRDFDFVNVENEMIKDIGTYDPSKVNNSQLADDWRIAMAWYSTKKTGGKIRHSIEEIINLAGIIYREIIKRVKEGKMKHDFDPDKMTPLSRELYNIVSKGKTGLSNSLSKFDLKDPKLLEHFEDKTIIKDFISVVGSYVEQRKGHVPNDIDLLVRMEKPSEFLRRAVEVRICKDLGFSDKIHFVWGDPEGPHDTFVPLYDLVLKKHSPLKRVKMQEEDLVSSEKTVVELAEGPFEPMKPGKRFYQPEELVKYMFENGKKYAVEKKFNGFRALLVKKDDSVMIFSDQKRDISKNFPTIRAEATKLSSKDFILDAELVYGTGGRSEIAKYVTGKDKLDDSKITLHAFDIINYFGEDISDKPWYERKQILHSLNFGRHIKEVHSIIVDSSAEASKAVKLLRNLPGSEGAIIKFYAGKYSKGGETDAWIKFRNEDTIHVRVMRVNKKEKGQTYTMGIKAPGNANEKYVEDEYLILGDTFVTDIKADVGDTLEVNIEETWRHKYPKQNDAIRYSVHKPRVMKKSDKSLTSWKVLDDLAVSKGEEVIENFETTTTTKGIKEVSRGVGDGDKVPSQKEQGPEDPESAEWDLSEKYQPPKAAKDNAQKVLDWKDKYGDEVRGMTPVGWARARQLASGKQVSADIVKRMAQFNRHRKNASIDIKYKDTPWKDAGYVAWLGWGGTEGIDWAISVSKSIDNSDTTISSPGISSIQGKSFPKKKPILPQQYYAPLVKNGKVIMPKVMNELSEELHDDDRLSLCEVFWQSIELQGEEQPGEGGTRSSAAEKFWENNWHNMFPKDGKGRFVYQHHWRGLTEDESKLSEEELLKSDHSLHGDFRGEVNKDELFGFTVFEGKAKDAKEKGGSKLVYESQHKDSPSKLQGAFKLAIPHEWLKVGSGKGTVSAPKGVGATEKKYAKFFIVDEGTYEMGVWREHMFEIFVNGKKLKGRMIVQYAPVGEGGRKWLVDFPKDQTPYAESHKFEDIVKELKQKKQKWLVWNKPGDKPKKINIEKEELKMATHGECKHFSNGHCNLKNIDVNPDGLACPKFEAR